jgi:hypothetical protein
VLTRVHLLAVEAAAMVLVGLAAWTFLSAMGAPQPSILAPSILALYVYLSRS